MTQGQWTVIGLLVALFALELALNKDVKNWLTNALKQIGSAL